jgi:tetratricopeptide (TPR) repeat protein
MRVSPRRAFKKSAMPHVPAPMWGLLTALFVLGIGWTALAAETQLTPSLSSPSIRAQRYLYSGRAELAVGSFKDAIKEGPDDWETLAALGAVMEAAGQAVDAVPFVTRAAALAKDDWTLRLFAASVLYSAGQKAQARAEFETIARSAPNGGNRQIAADKASGRYFTHQQAAEKRTWARGQPPPGDLWIGKLT